MKTLATITVFASMMISAAAVAMPIMPPPQKDMRVLSFDLIPMQSKVSPAHVKDFIGGGAEIHYANQTVTLKFWVAPSCPEGFACAEVLEVKSIELPIVDINTTDNNCATVVTAQQDQRPVDGIFQQITIEDFSKTTCNFFVKPVSDLKYVTSYVNRKNGKNVTNISNIKADLMNIADVEPAGEYYALKSGKYIKGFAKNEQVGSGNLTINEKAIRLEVYNKSNCPMGAMCLVGPTFLIVDFNIDSRELKGCVEVIKASAMIMGAGQKLVVKSHAHSPCDMMPKDLITAEYTQTIIAPKNKRPNQVAQFTFGYALTPFQK